MKSTSLHLLPVLLVYSVTLCIGPGQTASWPGESRFGHSNYVEYLAGDLPLIISAPHGGSLKPAELPDRAQGEFTSDANTELLARTLHQVFYQRFGRRPHVIICRLERIKVDCNREIDEGAGMHPLARQAWLDFHNFIDAARSNVVTQTGRGLYIDLHGQNHPLKRVELGYCLTPSQLTNADCVLNEGSAFARATSIRGLAERGFVPFSTLLRGTNSLGGLLQAHGYPAVPSPAIPDPGRGNSFFDGGYNVRRYGSSGGGSIDGVQMELNLKGIRDTAAHRMKFCLALAEVLQVCLTQYYGFDLQAK